jgi:hypothetical protein
MAPGAVAYTWLGHAGRGALSGEIGAIRYGLLGLGLLAAVAVLPRLIGRLRVGAAGRPTEKIARAGRNHGLPKVAINTGE